MYNIQFFLATSSGFYFTALLPNASNWSNSAS